jgi:tRNA threonylcarbamoyladenosine dehydratase
MLILSVYIFCITMIEQWQERTVMLLGAGAVERLASAHVLVVGLGGVGAWAAELLCRAGVGSLTIVDGDTVHPSNRNRQLLALTGTEGFAKAELMQKRLTDINPSLRINAVARYLKDEALHDVVMQHPYDFVVDAIDTLAPKLHLIRHSLEAGIPLVSSMGSGGKTDPAQVQVDDIDRSYNCRLAATIRKRLHRMEIRTGFKVVYSTEKTDKSKIVEVAGEPNKKSTVGTVSYMPPLFGCHIASVVIREIAAG